MKQDPLKFSQHVQLGPELFGEFCVHPTPSWRTCDKLRHLVNMAQGFQMFPLQMFVKSLGL